MQVTKETWSMREQCVPGSLSSSSAQEPKGLHIQPLSPRVCHYGSSRSLPEGMDSWGLRDQYDYTSNDGTNLNCMTTCTPQMVGTKLNMWQSQIEINCHIFQ